MFQFRRMRRRCPRPGRASRSGRVWFILNHTTLAAVAVPCLVLLSFGVAEACRWCRAARWCAAPCGAVCCPAPLSYCCDPCTDCYAPVWQSSDCCAQVPEWGATALPQIVEPAPGAGPSHAAKTPAAERSVLPSGAKAAAPAPSEPAPQPQRTPTPPATSSGQEAPLPSVLPADQPKIKPHKPLTPGGPSIKKPTTAPPSALRSLPPAPPAGPASPAAAPSASPAKSAKSAKPAAPKAGPPASKPAKNKADQPTTAPAPKPPAKPATKAEPNAKPTNKKSSNKLDDLFGAAARHGTPSAQTASDRPANDRLRRWTDNTGYYSCQGRLVRIFNDRIRILKANGRTTTVPLSRLSRADLQYVHAEKLAAQRPAPARQVAQF